MEILTGNMECVKFNKKGRCTDFVETPVPRITGDEDAIVRVELAGICHTDFDVIYGDYFAVDKVILGHEIIGQVLEIPKSCTKFRMGDRVLVNPCSPCAITKSYESADGADDFQIVDADDFQIVDANKLSAPYDIGKTDDGGWARYCRVKLSQLVLLPPLLGLTRGILCEPLSRVLYALDNRLNVANFCHRYSEILIVGAGLIGLLFTCVLHSRGYKNVFVVEGNPERRLVLQSLRTSYRCLSWEKFDEIKRKRNPTPITIKYCIDCTGCPSALRRCFSNLRRGGTMLMSTISKPPNTIRLPVIDCFEGEFVIIASANSTEASILDAFGCINSLVEKYIPRDLQSEIFKLYPLKDHKEALVKKPIEGAIVRRYFTPFMRGKWQPPGPKKKQQAKMNIEEILGI